MSNVWLCLHAITSDADKQHRIAATQGGITTCQERSDGAHYALRGGSCMLREQP